MKLILKRLKLIKYLHIILGLMILILPYGIYARDTDSPHRVVVKIEDAEFSLGAEFEMEFLSSGGDDAFAFNNGNQAVTHTNLKTESFRIDKLTIIPMLTLGDHVKFYSELEALSSRDETNATIFREAHVRMGVLDYFYVKAGLDERFMSPEFMADIDAYGENKRLTEVYPINGTAFWKDEDLGLEMGGDYPLNSDTTLAWKMSLTNGLFLAHDEITRNRIFPILSDDRDKQNINFDTDDGKEWGLGLGFKHFFKKENSFNLLGFFYTSTLPARDINFLNDVLPSYTSRKDTNQMAGGNLDLNFANLNVFTQYLSSKDGKVGRDGFYIQPSYLFKIKEDWLRSIRALYRYNYLGVDLEGSQNVSTSPFTWDRQTHTLALNFDIYKFVTFRNEFHWNLEKTGSSDDVKNNEFLSQLEMRF